MTESAFAEVCARTGYGCMSNTETIIAWSVFTILAIILIILIKKIIKIDSGKGGGK